MENGVWICDSKNVWDIFCLLIGLLYLVAASISQGLEELLEYLTSSVGEVASVQKLPGCLFALVGVHHDIHLAIQCLGQAFPVLELSLLCLETCIALHLPYAHFTTKTVLPFSLLFAFGLLLKIFRYSHVHTCSPTWKTAQTTHFIGIWNLIVNRPWVMVKPLFSH